MRSEGTRPLACRQSPGAATAGAAPRDGGPGDGHGAGRQDGRQPSASWASKQEGRGSERRSLQADVWPAWDTARGRGAAGLGTCGEEQSREVHNGPRVTLPFAFWLPAQPAAAGLMLVPP